MLICSRNATTGLRLSTSTFKKSHLEYIKTTELSSSALKRTLFNSEGRKTQKTDIPVDRPVPSRR